MRILIKSLQFYDKISSFLLWFSILLIVLNQTILGLHEDLGAKFPKLEVVSSSISSGISIYSGFKLKKFQNFTAIAIFLSTGSVVIAKKIIKKERPDKTNFKSFPSGHSVILATFLTQFAISKNFKSFFITLPLAFFVFAQRVLCGRHFAEDVIASIILAVAISLITKKCIYYVKSK